MNETPTTCGTQRPSPPTVMVQLPNDTQVLACLDEHGTVDMDSLHPQCYALEERPAGCPDETHKLPLRIGRDSEWRSRSARMVPLCAGKTYFALVPALKDGKKKKKKQKAGHKNDALLLQQKWTLLEDLQQQLLQLRREVVSSSSSSSSFQPQKQREKQQRKEDEEENGRDKGEENEAECKQPQHQTRLREKGRSSFNSSSSSSLPPSLAFPSGGDVIQVNVGGSVFITLRSTLCRFEGSFLEAMFSGRHLTNVDANGCYFIDRNPTYFQLILDFLRDPLLEPELPAEARERERFLRELDYYGLKGVMIGEKEEAEELCKQGYAFYNGRGVERDPAKAVEYWQRAAELGNAKAQNRLAICYKNGEGVEKDYFRAIPLYEKAAEQGYRDAQYNLACEYKNGEVVPRNREKAIYWFRKAADQGDPDARRMLEIMDKQDRGQMGYF
ncbi:Sel1 domain protein repeat-containing protein [Balamuthia mandrillaris]